jgi:two-component system response regulator
MRKFSILVAEDDADDRFLLRKAFEEIGLSNELVFVEDGSQLMEYLQKNLSTSPQNYPKLIILDLNMPLKDGRQALKEIKDDEVFRKIPVVIFTTSRNELIINHCYDLGANTYIIKPISYDSLTQIVAQIKAYWIQTAALPA